MRAAAGIAPGEIHLWLASYEEMTDTQQAAYRSLLNPAERAQEPRFYFARDRRRYLLTRALVRTVLSRYGPVDPPDWVFATNAYGRPQIANAAAAECGLSFNISHTHSLIVLGVTLHGELGVDVENVTAREAPVSLAGHYFAATEVTALAALPAHLQPYRFFEYWTFKESYIKARGMGLSLPLDKFSFQFPNERSVNIAIHPELADNPLRWQFWQFQPTPDYLVAVCAPRVGEESRLIVRTGLPGAMEQRVVPQILRRSQ